MTLRITGTEAFLWPDDAALSAALGAFGLQTNDLASALLAFSDNTDPTIRRYTEAVAGNLADHLATTLIRNGLRATTRQLTNRYSPGLDHHADLVIARHAAEQRLYFEIEFRPNFEKDLVKFRVGHLVGRLAAGILIVALDRRTIRGSYTTMPEFGSVVTMIRQFRPDHPVAVLGMGLTLDPGSGTA
jgi:hypothetical protein